MIVAKEIFGKKSDGDISISDRKLIEKCYDEGEYLTRLVEYQEEIPGIEGRLVPKKIYHDSLAYKPKNKRDFLLSDIDYVEFDVVNCFPTILVKLCEENDIPCPTWIYHNENRDIVLGQVIDLMTDIEMIFSDETERKYAKKFIFNALYGFYPEDLQTDNPYVKGLMIRAKEKGIPDSKNNSYERKPIQEHHSYFILKELADEAKMLMEALYKKNIIYETKDILSKEIELVKFAEENYEKLNENDFHYNLPEHRSPKTFYMYLLFVIEERKIFNSCYDLNNGAIMEPICFLCDGIIFKGTEKEIVEKLNKLGFNVESLQELVDRFDIKVKVTEHEKNN